MIVLLAILAFGLAIIVKAANVMKRIALNKQDQDQEPAHAQR